MRLLGRILVAPGILLIRIYQKVISPLLPPACRFSPTCSEYFAQSLKTWGPLKGTWLGVRRIFKCHPFHPGGDDPVPKRDEQAE